MVKDMTAGKPFRLILAFTGPMLLGTLLQQIYSLADAIIVGRFLGVNALAGVGASTSVIFLILGFCNGTTSGFGIPIAQAFGAKNYHRMRAYVSNSYTLGWGISLVLTVATALLCAHILRWMQTPEEIFADAYAYLLVTFICIPLSLMYNLLASIIRALGDSKTPFYFLLIASVLNIVLDVFFIVVLRAGTGGAAVATGLAQGISVVLCWLYMRRHFPIIYETPDRALSRRQRYGDWRAQKTLLGMGVPMGLQFSITAIGSIMLQSANNALGTACATAFTAGMRLKMLFMCPFDCLGAAIATYCGQNFGAGKTDRIHSGIKDTVLMTLAWSVVCWLALFPFGRQLSMLFVDATETQVLDLSAQFLRFNVSFFFLLGVLILFRSALQGIGHAKLSMWSGVTEMCARIFVSLVLVPALGFLGVCLGDITAWTCACCFLIPTFYLVMRRETAAAL